jgi:transposase InsO family protein
MALFSRPNDQRGIFNNRGRGGGGGGGGGRGGARGGSSNRGGYGRQQASAGYPSSMVCHTCKGTGHGWAVCPSRTSEGAPSEEKSNATGHDKSRSRYRGAGGRGRGRGQHSANAATESKTEDPTEEAWRWAAAAVARVISGDPDDDPDDVELPDSDDVDDILAYYSDDNTESVSAYDPEPEPELRPYVSPFTVHPVLVARENLDEEKALSLSGTAVEVWDSGASTHMSPYRSLFTSFTEGSSVKVSVADDRILQAKGRGEMDICIPNGSEMTTRRIKNVLYVPDMSFTLVSIRQITRSGVQVCFDDDDHCYLYDKKAEVEIGSVGIGADGLYSVTRKLPSVKAYSVKKKKLTLMEAHRILGHIDPDSVKRMVRDGVVDGIEIDPKSKEEQCEACIRGKIAKTPMPKSISGMRSTSYGEIVHTDVWGPASVEAIGRFKYYITFTDDFSRETVLFPMAEKSQSFDRYLAYEAWVKLHREAAIKNLRSDRGGEYLSKLFSDHLEKNGTKRQLTVHHTPAQNGVSERKNRTLVERTRTIMLENDAPKNLWAEALRHVVWMANRTASRTLGGRSPLEVATGKRADMSKMQPWYTEVWVKLEKAGKLDSQAERARFLGMDAESKGIRVYWGNNRTSVERNFAFSKGKALAEVLQHLIEEATQVDSSKVEYLDIPEFSDTQNDEEAIEKELTAGNDSFESETIDFMTPTPEKSRLNVADLTFGSISPASAIVPDTAPGPRVPKIDAPGNPFVVPGGLADGRGWPVTKSMKIPFPASPIVGENGSYGTKSGTDTPFTTSSGDEELFRELRLPEIEVPPPSPTPARPRRDIRPTEKIRAIQRGEASGSGKLGEVPKGVQIRVADMEKSSERASVAYALGIVEKGVPKTVPAAMKTPEWPHWRDAIDAELAQFERFGTWTLVEPPAGVNIVGSRFVFATKTDANGEVVKHKARVVAQGFSQQYGQDYVETFSPTAKPASIRTLLALAAAHDWEIQQIDVKGAFLNANLEEDIYMAQPPHYAKPGQEHLVCKLNKALYGLKQAGQQWHKRLSEVLASLGFQKSVSDHAVFYCVSGSDVFFIPSHVDDLTLISTHSRSNSKNTLKSPTSAMPTGYLASKFVVIVSIGHFRSRKWHTSTRSSSASKLARCSCSLCRWFQKSAFQCWTLLTWLKGVQILLLSCTRRLSDC